MSFLILKDSHNFPFRVKARNLTMSCTNFLFSFPISPSPHLLPLPMVSLVALAQSPHHSWNLIQQQEHCPCSSLCLKFSDNNMALSSFVFRTLLKNKILYGLPNDYKLEAHSSTSSLCPLYPVYFSPST